MRNILEFKKPSKKECAHLRVLTNQIRSVVFLNHVLEHPDQIYDYARLYASSVAAILAWGFRARNFESFFFKNFYDFVDQVRLDHSLPGCTNSKKWLEAIEPGANPPVDQVPWMWYLPGKWKKRAYHVRNLMDTTWSTARAMVDKRRADGDVRDSIIDMKLAEYDKSGWPMTQYAFNNLFGEFLEAGADSMSILTHPYNRESTANAF